MIEEVNKNRVAKIVTTTYAPRSYRKHTRITPSRIPGNKSGYFDHSQNYKSVEEINNLINYHVEEPSACYTKTPMDLIIINNDIGNSQGNDYLNALDKKQLQNGFVYVHHRENIGRSFGGYNYAVKRYGDKYSHYIFTEDDILVYGKNYIEETIDLFDKDKKIGFVAFQGINTCRKMNYDESIHAHGGVGMATYKVLSEVIKLYNDLPYSLNPKEQKIQDIIKHGEVKFTNCIHNLGYKLIASPEAQKFYEYAYDYERGIKLPRYAGNISILLDKIKRKSDTIRYEFRQFRSKRFNSR